MEPFYLPKASFISIKKIEKDIFPQPARNVPPGRKRRNVPRGEKREVDGCFRKLIFPYIIKANVIHPPPPKKKKKLILSAKESYFYKGELDKNSDK